MTPQPPALVSIVTPTLDAARFLAETLESVRSQDYAAIEHLVVDAGSRDGTADVVARFPSVRWIAAPGAGQSAAINLGWRRSRGQILAWLNADDCYQPGAVARAAAAFAEKPGVDVVYGACDYVDPTGRILRAYPVRRHDPVALLRDAVNTIAQPASFLRRAAVERVGALAEDLSHVMDFDLWLRLGAGGHHFEQLHERLATLRLHDEAKSLRSLAGFAPELVLVYRRLFADAKLPAPLRAVEAEAVSNVYYRASACLYWAGRLAEAREHALIGWRHSRSNLRPQLLYALLGASGRDVLRRLRGNPFRLGLPE